MADGPADPIHAERGARHARARASHDRDRRRVACATSTSGRRPASSASCGASRSASCFTVAAWNYPYLIAVNSVVPALMAGNTVVLKHSAQTPLCAERFAECFREAGLPIGCFAGAAPEPRRHRTAIVGDPRVDFVAFTGSVAGGHAIQRAAAERFVGTGLELGGCDPAYVRHDADLAHAVENLVDGAYFNSGQSCCGIQRVYVHEQLYDDFVAGWVELTQQVRARQSARCRDDARSGRAHGGRRRDSPPDRASACAPAPSPLIDEGDFAASEPGTPYLAPQVLRERRPLDAGDARGNLRAGRRHHARARRTSEAVALHERQCVRTHRRDLDRRRRRGLAIGDQRARPARGS